MDSPKPGGARATCRVGSSITYRGVITVAKDKGAKKGNDKTPASKTLKEKRAAKKSKGKATI